MTVLLPDASVSASAPTFNPDLPPESSPTPGWYATPSQQLGLKRLNDMAEVFLWSGHEKRAGFKPMTRTLLIGESGSGKSRLAEEFSRQREWPLLSIDCGSWLPQGAISKPSTLRLIRDHIRANAGKFCALFMDELCKLVPAGDEGKSSWSLSCWSEFLALGDCDSRLRTHEWTDQDIRWLRDFCFVIGGGAFTSALLEFRTSSRRGDLGFQSRSADSARATYSGKIREVLPEEILSRFHPAHVVLQTPSRNDYASAIERIHDELGVLRVRPIKELLDEAQSALGGLRWVEAYLADLLVSHPVRFPIKEEQQASRERQDGFNFFTGDSMHYAREATESSFRLRAVLARLLAELNSRHNAISKGRNTAFTKFLFGEDDQPLAKLLSKALTQANACTEVRADDSRVTDPIMNWREKAWVGLLEYPAELTRYGMIGLFSQSWDLSTRVCELRGHISMGVAAGRYTNWGQV